MHNRIKSLDSIRGIAALIVLFHHCYLLINGFEAPARIILDTGSFLLDRILSIFINSFTAGPSAVIIFFILSGFVLTLSLLNREQSYKHFLLSRIFRIYPVLFVSLFISYLLHLLIGINNIPPDSIASEWYRTEFFPKPPVITDFLGSLALTGIKPDHIYLNAPSWSMVHEMRISLIFPFLVLLFSTSKEPAKFLVLAFIISMLGAIATDFMVATRMMIAKDGLIEGTFLYPVMGTVSSLIFFVMGIFLALRRERMNKAIGRLSSRNKLFLLLAAILALVYYDYDVKGFVSYLRAIGAVVLLSLAFSWHGFEKFLHAPVLQWLGRISYSLYLVHWFVIYLVVELLGQTLSLWQLILIIIILSLICAELMSRLVEYPCINLGKKLLRKVP